MVRQDSLFLARCNSRSIEHATQLMETRAPKIRPSTKGMEVVHWKRERGAPEYRYSFPRVCAKLKIKMGLSFILSLKRNHALVDGIFGSQSALISFASFRTPNLNP